MMCTDTSFPRNVNFTFFVFHGQNVTLNLSNLSGTLCSCSSMVILSVTHSCTDFLDFSRVVREQYTLG